MLGVLLLMRWRFGGSAGGFTLTFGELGGDTVAGAMRDGERLKSTSSTLSYCDGWRSRLILCERVLTGRAGGRSVAPPADVRGKTSSLPSSSMLGPCTSSFDRLLLLDVVTCCVPQPDAPAPSITSPPRLAAVALACDEQLVSARSSSSSRDAESSEPALALSRLQLSSGDRDRSDIRSSPMLPPAPVAPPALLPGPPPSWKMVESVDAQSDDAVVVSWKE
uniref:Secreted protein n=1 Tax=Anopheles merus TaxID=30066 RepID=A0A182UXP8_ANOME